MKRGGAKFTVAIFAFVASLMSATLFSAPVVQAVPGDNNNTNSTEQTDNNNGSNENNSSSTDSDDQCESGLMGFGWILCPGQNLITQLIDGIAGWISDSMNWTILADQNGQKIHEIWQDFLNVANVAFALIFIFMIYSMATSTGLSNYDIKKILPRLILVAIAVNVSFYICAGLVDLSNIAGKGAYGLIYSHTEQGDAWTIVANVTHSITSIALMVLALFLFGGTVVIGLAVSLVAIAFRQLLLVVLVIISPLAFALYLLPNTQKMAQTWFDTFTKLLLVYPMFTAVWGASRLVSNIFASSGSSSIPAFLTDFLCAIAPALSILPLFRMSGNIMGGAIKAIEGNDNVKKIKKGINKAERNAAANSQMATNLRRWGSSNATRIQETLGNHRVVGNIVRSPGFNKAVSYAANTEAKYDKQALEDGTNWVKQNLNSKQIQEVINTGGTYTDNYGRQATLTDTYKIMGAIDEGKGGRSGANWITGMRSMEQLASNLSRQGRGIEGSKVINAYRNAMKSEKPNILTGGAINDWGDSQGWGNDFDKKLALGVAAAAGGMSQEKASKTSAGDHASIQRAIANAPIDTMSDTEKAQLDQNVAKYQAVCAATQHNTKLASNMNQVARSTMGIGGADYIRTSSEQAVANELHIDHLVRDYNSNSRQKVGDAMLAARHLVGTPHDFSRLRRQDQQIILQMATDTTPRSSNKTPIPVTIWTDK